MQKDRYTRRQVRFAMALTLKSLRRKAGNMSQEELAFSSGVDRSYVGELERGLRSPTIETICRLMPALGVTCAVFGREFDKNLKQEDK